MLGRVTLIALLIWIQAGSLFLSPASASEGIYTSPYSADGIHCTGLAQQSGDSPGETPGEIDPIKTYEAQEDCDDLFRSFGIEKYMQLSSEDLERISAEVRQTVYFESAHLSIKKSDLKNHIHILLNVKTKPRYVYHFTVKSKAYGDTESPRFFNRIGGEVTDRAFQPNSNSAWGFHLDTGFASTPLTRFNSEWNRTVNADEIYNKNFYYLELYYKHQTLIGKSWTWSVIGRLNADNTLAGKVFDFSPSLDTDLIYSKYFRFLHGTLFGGPSAIFTPDFGYLASLYANQPTGTYDTPMLLPGFKVGYLFGKGVGTYFRTELSGYRALYGTKSIFEWKSIFQVDLGAGYLVNTSFNGKQSRDLILARDKSPSTDALNNTVSMAVVKSLGHPTADRRELELKAGIEKLGYTESPWVSGASPFIQAGYRVFSDTLNLDLSFSYLTRRLY